MANVAELGEAIANLTIAQAVELKNLLKEKYGIEPAAGGAVMVAGPAAAAAAAAEKAAEATEFNVILEGGFDTAKKVGIIKETAEDVKKKLEEAGAKVTVKPAG